MSGCVLHAPVRSRKTELGDELSTSLITAERLRVSVNESKSFKTECSEVARMAEHDRLLKKSSLDRVRLNDWLLCFHFVDDLESSNHSCSFYSLVQISKVYRPYKSSKLSVYNSDIGGSGSVRTSKERRDNENPEVKHELRRSV